MERIKSLLSNIFNATNSTTDSAPISVNHVPTDTKSKYNRHERRTGHFVIYNTTSKKYAKSYTNNKGEIVFKDVALKDASLYIYNSLDYVMNSILLAEPNVNIEPRMVFKHKGKLKTK